MMLTHFLSAFALVLVFEGMLPFLSPGKWRQMLLKIIEIDDRRLHFIGLASMLAGVLLLYLIHG